MGDARLGVAIGRWKTPYCDGTPLHRLLTADDPLTRDELQMASAMIQFTIVFGAEKTIASLPRTRMLIPKPRHYELTANIYQAQQLVRRVELVILAHVDKASVAVQ